MVEELIADDKPIHNVQPVVHVEVQPAVLPQLQLLSMLPPLTSDQIPSGSSSGVSSVSGSPSMESVFECEMAEAGPSRIQASVSSEPSCDNLVPLGYTILAV